MQSQLRPTHKRHNWFVGIFPLNAENTSVVAIRPVDVTFSTLRAGGPGGQHQNTTDSAVRATHIPIGLTVVARDARSQDGNRALALERLQEIADAQTVAMEEDRKSRRNQHHRALERGNPIRQFNGPKFREVRR